MQRRGFIGLLGGAAATWPLAVPAQQGERVRRIAVLLNLAADDPEGRARLAAFVQALAQLGWSEGRNVKIDTRWATVSSDRLRGIASEIVALAPDVILVQGSTSLRAFEQATSTI
ncbi:MAG: ABC transporter substrate-binding protein, partial [Alphaproteobacteria bacterium]